METELIFIGILLMSSTTIFFKYFRKLPSKGNWIYEYEDEKWAQILIIVVRILAFMFGLIILISTLFFNGA